MKIKIKLVCGWDTSESATQRILSQFLINSNFIEFVYDDSYDIIVYNNYITENPKQKAKSFLFFHEPSWSGHHQKSIDTNTIVFGYNKNNYNCINFIESFSHMFYGGRGSWSEGDNFWTYNNLINTKLDNQKTKNISSIVSGWGSDPQQKHPDGCIYRQRYAFVKQLEQDLKFIDFFGDKGKELRLKKDGLIDYKFSIAIENTNEKNYVSEKFYDPILVDTIPIYFGCANIQNLWPQNGYILLDNIIDKDYLIEKLTYINNNADELYRSMIKNTMEIKHSFLTEVNLYKQIEKYAVKFELCKS